jgi:HPt (histidine-containing phosphotransfer) domain-containing protein
VQRVFAKAALTSCSLAATLLGGEKQLPLDGLAEQGCLSFGLARKQGSETMNKKEEGLSELVWNVAELLERVDNDQDLLRELLTIFKEDFPQSFGSLRTAVIAGDLKSASRLSHTLKGMLSSLGATRAAAAAAKLESLSFAGETTSLRDALSSLESEADRLLPELDAYMPEVRR